MDGIIIKGSPGSNSSIRFYADTINVNKYKTVENKEFADLEYNF
jgi:hypothetical protein